MRGADGASTNTQRAFGAWTIPLNLATLAFAIVVGVLPVYLPRPPSWAWVLVKKNGGGHRYFYPGYMIPNAAAASYRAVTLGEAYRQGLAPPPGADLAVKLPTGGEYLLLSSFGPVTWLWTSRYMICWAATRGNQWLRTPDGVQLADGMSGRIIPHPRHPVLNWLKWFYGLVKPTLALELTILGLSMVCFVALTCALVFAAERSRRANLWFRLGAVGMVAVWYAVSWAFPATSTFFAAVSFIWWPAVILLALTPLMTRVLTTWRRKRELGRRLSRLLEDHGSTSA